MPVKRNKKTPSRSDWRSLVDGPNKKKPKTVTVGASIRIFLQKLKFFVMLALFGALCYTVYVLYSTSFFDDIIGTDSEKIKHIEFKTDGVITSKWIGSYVHYKDLLSRNKTLAEADIFAIKNALENLTQIKKATVERVYPDKLRITVSEQRPMAKAITQKDMRTILYIVSPEGVFYEPICMNETYVKDMPLITGYQLNFNGRTPQELKCAPKIVEFLAYSQSRMPMQKWKSINIRDLESVAPILVASTENDVKIIFAPKDYKKQFDRLEYVLKYSKENNIQDIKQIDLSLKERADVKLKTKQK